MMNDSFLPAMRELVSRKLSEQGFSQGRIASMLGVTQASVSLYLRGKGRSRSLLDRLGVTPESGDVYASLLAEDVKKNPVYAVNTLYSIWSDILGKGAMCEAHRSQYPSLARCDMCMKTFTRQVGGEEDIIDLVADAVKLVESSSAFVSVMPEVSVNIANARPNASSVREVVAVPGRIVKVRGMPRSFMRPEYGASTHVASILLAVMSHDSRARAAMNLRYDDRVDRVIRRLGLKTLRLHETRGMRSDEEMLDELRDKLSLSPAPVDAIVDSGGPGIEPGLYLFATDALKVAELGIKVARDYIGEG